MSERRHAPDPARVSTRGSEAEVAAMLARIPGAEMDALVASIARLLISAVSSQGPPRRRIRLDGLSPTVRRCVEASERRAS